MPPSDAPITKRFRLATLSPAGGAAPEPRTSSSSMSLSFPAREGMQNPCRGARAGLAGAARASHALSATPPAARLALYKAIAWRHERESGAAPHVARGEARRSAAGRDRGVHAAHAPPLALAASDHGVVAH